MKKFRFLIVFMIVAISFSFSSYATDVPTPTTDNVTENEIVTDVPEYITGIENIPFTPETELPDVPELPDNVIELPDNATEEDLRMYWETFKENISKLSVWLTAFLSTSGVAIMAYVVKWGITKILEKIADNARNTDTKIDDKLVAHKDEIMKAFDKMSEKLNNTITNEEKMYEVLSVFILNSNEPASCKAEMLEMIAGIKKYNGELSEVVKKAQENIDKVRDEKVTLAGSTPELDKLVEEKERESQYMKLG